jgi:hypothetical protein
MTRIYVAMQNSLAIVTGRNTDWKTEIQLDGLPVFDVAVDPFNHERLYAATMGQGLWRSDDSGTSWNPVGQGIKHDVIMSVAVSPLERFGKYGVVWAGTEPSALFRSENGGESWQERPALLDLASKPTWSYPPKPDTHHVRWIQPDRHEPGLLFVAIEQGGIMRSLDGGLTWEDRKPGAQRDGHTLRTHKLAPGRVYEAAGGEDPQWVEEPLGKYVVMSRGGYAETRDGGATWETITDGLDRHYFFGMAIDPGDPDIIVASVTRGPEQAHRPPTAESFIYRRAHGKPWQLIDEGLPSARGTLVYSLAANEDEPGVFYAATNRGLFCSSDAGETWRQLDAGWPERYRMAHARGMQVVS